MKYRVHAWVAIDLYGEVEADSKEEAKEAAGELGVPGLCHHCASKGGGGQWGFDGLSDEVTIVEVEKSGRR